MGIYKSIEAAKNGMLIPVFQSGRTMESRYNPLRDAENLCNTINSSSNFSLVIGIGSGLFIQKLSDKFPSAKVIALEFFDEDVIFLRHLESVKTFENNPNIILTSLNKLQDILLQNYFPAKYGDLQIIEQKPWIIENQEKLPEIKKVIQKTLGIISADYSVQAHFGKIWTSNILNNAKLYKTHNTETLNLSDEIKRKTAVIVAAGPSLDSTVNILSDRDKFYIIATDTAGSSLIKRKIIPDVIISIDGQNVSFNHFLHSAPETLYAFDLCANSSAVQHIAENNARILFFCSGHPLSEAINTSSASPLPKLFSGAGTVTITAVDFALQSGFSKILILGADFSYLNGKAYTSGTYLESLYQKSSDKIFSAEKLYSKLMYRTSLIQISDNSFTTDILEAYKLSLEKYLEMKGISLKKENDIYEITISSPIQNPVKTKASASDIFETFMKKFISSTPEDTETILLPYIAWLRQNEKYKNSPYKELLKLAFDSIVSYNI